MVDLQKWWHVVYTLRTTAATTLAIALGLVSLSKQPQRPRLALLAISIPTFKELYFYNDISSRDSLNKISALFLIIWLAHISLLLCLVPAAELRLDRKRYQASAGQRLHHCSEHEAIHGQIAPLYPKFKAQRRDWWYAYKMLFSRTWAGAAADSDPNYGGTGIAKVGLQESKCSMGSHCSTGTTQSRQSFTFTTRQCSILLFRYIALCVYFDPSLYRNTMDGTPWTALDFCPEKSIFFRRLNFPTAFQSPITSRDILIRVWLVLDLLVSDYLVLTSFHEIFSIIAVGLHLDTPEEWLPLFGSITEAYTARKFWSCFWHRLIYRSFKAHASVFSRILRIRKGRRVSRYVNNALVFLLSGLMHTLVELKQPGNGPACGCWGVTIWYCMQLGAILAEELVQKAWAEVEKHLPLGKKEHLMLQIVKRALGYTWVIT